MSPWVGRARARARARDVGRDNAVIQAEHTLIRRNTSSFHLATTSRRKQLLDLLCNQMADRDRQLSSKLERTRPGKSQKKGKGRHEGQSRNGMEIGDYVNRLHRAKKLVGTGERLEDEERFEWGPIESKFVEFLEWNRRWKVYQW